MVLLAILCALAGCTAVDSDIRMSPTTSIDASHVQGANTLSTTNLPGGIVLYDVEPDGSVKQVTGLEALKPDLYVTVDVSPIVNAALVGSINKDARNRLTSFLIYLSDRNADIWESRVFAKYKLRTGIIGGTRDLATAGAGASSLIVPPVAAGLSAFNLFVGSFSDQLDTTLYSKETVETLLKAITASRKTFKNTMKSHYLDATTNYDMFNALDQLRHYDSLVSFRKGLAYVNSLTDQTSQAADAVANSTNVPSKPPAPTNLPPAGQP